MGVVDLDGDLPGKRVGVFAGSVAEAFAESSRFDFRSYQNIDIAAKALAAGQIDAIIGDAPVLEYFAHNNASARFTVVGPIFEPDKYAFALPRGSDYTLPITIELLDAIESDYLNKLDQAYFGASGK